MRVSTSRFLAGASLAIALLCTGACDSGSGGYGSSGGSSVGGTGGTGGTTGTSGGSTGTSGTSGAPSGDDRPPAQGSVPSNVVGVWCGGRNDDPNGHWTYAFAPDATFAAQNRAGGLSGYVVTTGQVMTFHLNGGTAPVRSTWSVGYNAALGSNVLSLDGFTYLPGSCG
ncbi:hypothetical protein [Streptomyces sp. NPDC060194]|uniref:hypothetical protein n=1 Tax=Streptomyces sp. NPDC060194 TaxID=3347069 RepID=UPI00365C3B08